MDTCTTFLHKLQTCDHQHSASALETDDNHNATSCPDIVTITERLFTYNMQVYFPNDSRILEGHVNLHNSICRTYVISYGEDKLD
jgi:hypothetical protein